MKRSTSCSLWLTLVLGALAAVLLLLCTAPASAEPDGMRAAWQRARQAGAYRFAADILQTTIPLPRVTNAGRQSQQDALYVEGQTNLFEARLELTVWSQGGSLFRAEDGLQVRVEEGRAWARLGAEAWEEINDFSGLFAPQGDALAYLAAARDVVEAGVETRAGISFTRYSFQVDGPRFAAYVRQQVEARLAEQGGLVPGAEVELPWLYAEMTGQGELWVGEDGLPLRQILHLQFPENQDERVEAEVDVHFSGFGVGAAQALRPSPSRRSGAERTVAQAGVTAAMVVLVTATVALRRWKKMTMAIMVAVTVSMVVTPLLQSGRAAALADRQAARAREEEARLQEARLQEALGRQAIEERVRSAEASAAPGAASPRAPALIRGGGADAGELLPGSSLAGAAWGGMGLGAAQAAAAAQEGIDGDGDGLSDDEEKRMGSDPLEMDTDGDGLTDYEEVLLGTSPLFADSDGDLITDTLELSGYVYTSTAATGAVTNTFHSSPLEADTNHDGIGDWVEWYAGGDGERPGDSDGDGVPDIVDLDNDGDGAPDDLDLSPFQSGGEGRLFDGENPFSLIVAGLEAGKPTYVEFQVRPTNPDHLWYAFNVLDWPEDRKGQIMDGDGVTYDDLHPPAVDTAGARTNGNGDVKLVPMLEIVIPSGADNLPPERTLQELYGVYVQDTAAPGMGEGKVVYVPLQLVVDPVGGARVAFSGKMVYLPGEAWGEAQQVRLVWMVQALLDVCKEEGWKDGQCQEVDPARSNQPQVIQRYDDEWALTGLNVREDHGQQVGIIWEEPAKDDAPNDDEALFLLSEVLDETFLSGRDCDTPAADKRCQGDGERDVTVSELGKRLGQSGDREARWNLPDVLAMETLSYSHQDEALVSLVITDTRRILEEHFSGKWTAGSPITPTLVIVREEEFRANNLDALAGGTGSRWGGEKGRELTVEMGAEEVQPITMASVTWKPYRYAESTGWENCPVESYWAELERRYLGLLAGEGDAEEARARLFLLQFYYLTGYSGVLEIVQTGDRLRAGAPDSGADASLAQSILKQAGGAVKSIVNNLDYATTFYSGAFKELVGKKGLYSLPATDLTPETLKAIGEIDRLRLESGSGRSRSNAIWGRDAIPDQPLTSKKTSGLNAATVVCLGLTAANIALLLADFYSESEGVKSAATVSTYTVAAVGLGLGAMEIYQSYKLVSTMVGNGMTRSSALLASSEVAGASRAAAKVGLIVGIAISVGFFVAGLVQALDAGANSVQIQMMAAQLIAQIIMAVLMFVLSASIIGNVIVAVMIIFDTIMSLLGLEDYTTAALLAKALYGYSMIAEPNCALGDSSRSFVGPGRGIVGGNTMVLTQTITATATMADPTDIRAIPYLPALWTEDLLRGSQVTCRLENRKQDLAASYTAWERVVADHGYLGWNMRRAEADATASLAVPLASEINFTPAISLNMGYEVPVANCWMVPIWFTPLIVIPVCYPTSIDDSQSTDLGALMAMDVLPATVEGFYWWGELGTQQDHDGDGLRAMAVNGNDPDDTTWDADGDGLADAYELERRSRGGQQAGTRPSLLSMDTDGDGLSDADEIRLGTFPNKRDSDGDGVKDAEEVVAYDANAQAWKGGWQYSYTFNAAPGVTETKAIGVTSDPLSLDTDGDGLNDGVERALGENPRAWTPNPQGLEVEISDADGIIGPGQTLVVSATLENQIQMDPGYFLTGTLTTTLPGAPGKSVESRAYELYQGELVTAVRALTVPGDAASGEVAIASQARGWLHDGYITDTYRLAPEPASLLASIPVTGPVYANVAASPGGADLFAVATAQGSRAVHLRSANRVLTQAADLRGDQGCGPGVGQVAPGVACNDEGRCLTAWSNSRYHDEDNTLTFRQVVVSWECDGWQCAQDESEFAIKVNGDEVWSRSVDDGGTFPADQVVEFDDEAVVEVWEEDPPGDRDDWVGGHTLTPCHVGHLWRRATDCSCKHPAADAPDDPDWYAHHPQQYYDDCKCDSGDDGHFWIEYDVVTHLWNGIYGAVSEHGAPSQQPLFEAAGIEQDRQRPAVASDGTQFLVVWQQDSPAITATQALSEPANLAVYASQVFSDGTPGAAVRLDAPGPGDDSRPAVAWAGDGRYIVVWHSSAPGGIEMAAVTSDGLTVEGSRQAVAAGASHAQVAANPDSGQALVVYVQECTGGPCIKGRPVGPAGGAGLTVTVGAEIEIAAGVQVAGAPAVAYEPRYGGWVVSWHAAPLELDYALLSAAGEPLLLKTGRGPQATFQAISGTVATDEHPSAQAVACSPETTDYAQCALVASSGERLTLQPLFLELVPALVGPITTTVVTSVTIDADPPTSTITSLADGQSLAAGGMLVIGGDAADGSSGVARVQISVNGGDWQDVEGAESWAFGWQTPGSDGPVTLSTRATDLLGNTGANATIRVMIDRTQPEVDLAAGDIISATRQAGGWSLGLSGTVRDGYSGVDKVEVLVTPNGNGWQRAVVEGNGWRLAYALSGLTSDGALLPDPGGAYMVQVRAADAAGNETPAPAVRALSVDATPPEVTVVYPTTRTAAITTTVSLAGEIGDPGPAAAGVAGLEVSFRPAGRSPTMWLPATLDREGPGVASTGWNLAVPGDLEGMVQIDLRAKDVLGNSSDSPSSWDRWRGEIDTLAPRTAITVTLRGAGHAAQTVYEGQAEDLNLTSGGFEFGCAVEAADRHYYDDAWWTATTGDTRRLHRLAPACIVTGRPEAAPSLTACDGYGHCAVQTGTPLSEPVALASAVLTPAHETVLSSTRPISLTIGAFGRSGLNTLTLTINGAEEHSFAWPAAPTDTVTATTWTPPGEGRYALVTVARDLSGTIQSELQPITITVDVEDPTVALTTTVLTMSHRLSFRRVALSGSAADTVGLEEVAVSVDGSAWQAARLDGAGWRYPWFLGPGEHEPDGETHTVSVRATDAAGHTVQVTEPVTVDLTPPVPVTLNLAYDAGDGPVPLEIGQTLRQISATLVMSWPESADPSGPLAYLAGWSTEITPAMHSLASAVGEQRQLLAEPQALYGHLLARDGSGNSRVQTAGPVYLDGPSTPDLVADLDYHGWMESGCTLIGADRDLARHVQAGAYLTGTQSLHASWDREALRLAWSGADWNVSGDLFVYLDTRPGMGLATVYDPYGKGPAIGLPAGMAADWAVWIEDGETAVLLTPNAQGEWQAANGTPGEMAFRLDAGRLRSDLLLPFTLLGIDPGAPTEVSMVALASEEDALRIWAAMPDDNPLNSELAANALASDYLGLDYALTQRYRWSSLGDGQCPSQGQFANVDLRLSLTAEPPGLQVGFLEHDLPGLLIPGRPLDGGDMDGKPDVSLPVDDQAALLGHGQTVTYSLSYANLGAGVAPGAMVTLTARGALELAGGTPMTVSLDAVSGTLLITGSIDAGLDGESAELDAVVGTATRGGFDWLWVQHGVDTEPPVDLQLLAPAAYVGRGLNQALGTVSDPSGVPTVTLEVQPGGTVICADTTPRDGTWACTWDAGNPGDGAQIQLRARATDRFGASGDWTAPVTVTVDATPPRVTLSEGTNAALRHDALLGPDELWLSGQVEDERRASAVQVCVAAPGEEAAHCELFGATYGETPQIAGWHAPAPVLADSDGVTQTFSFYGYDSVGNRTPGAVTATARVDIVAPTIDATPSLGQVAQGTNTTLLEGTVHDGSGVMRLLAYVAGPGLQTRWYDQDDDELRFDGEAWRLNVRFDEPGAYSLGLEAWDLAGNVGRRGPFQVEVVPPAADLSLRLSALPQTAIGGLPLAYTARVANAGPHLASGTVLTLTLPAGIRLQRPPLGCDREGDWVVCSLGDLAPGQTADIRLNLDLPFTVAQTLVCQATASSGTFDPALGDNRRTLVTPVRPSSPHAKLVCDGPNLLANGSFEQGFRPNGVARSWTAFNNGGGARYGYGDDAWDAVVSEGRHSQLINVSTVDIRGPTQPNRICGIYQTVRLLPGFTYELSLDAMIREVQEHPMEDPYRYMVGWGYSRGGTGMDYGEWLPLRAIYPIFKPGIMQSYRTRFEAPGEEVTVWLYAMKKWATLGRELNVNVDNAALRFCRPVTTGAAPPPR